MRIHFAYFGDPNNDGSLHTPETIANRMYRYLQARADVEYYNFMDLKTYEQYEFSAGQIGEGVKFLKEEMEIHMMMYEGDILGVRLPIKVDLKVIEAPPGVKGDTAGSVTKPVTLETGAVVNAPLFIKEGELIKIDTRTGEYVERSK